MNRPFVTNNPSYYERTGHILHEKCPAPSVTTVACDTNNVTLRM